ncbi:MAG: FAD:protein FMN transferase [Deltaproteobacteria bacterium]|nr:MAG: FAD:protein FMN transferase [Deltaproteobacteria bacterium]
MRRPLQRASAALALALVALTAPAHAEDAPAGPHFAYRARGVMGTRFQIMAYVPDVASEAVLDRALDRVVELDELLSPWIAGSDVQKINAAAGGEPVKVAPLTLALMQRTRAFCEATGRAFDPTFFPLSPLYDFRDPAHFRPPLEADIARVLPLIDCRDIAIDVAAGTVGLKRHGMGLHLGGNAKGTALDEAAKVLEAAGVTRYYVDGGGDIVVHGDGPKGPWRVGIQAPRAARGEAAGVIKASGGAVVTSGDYERFVVVDGVRYSHIVDPRTGKPATGCMSATVKVPPMPRAGEVADGWATTVCVLGAERGFALLLEHLPGAGAAVIDLDGKVHETPGFGVPIAPVPTEGSPHER